ncbi:hypothetical protein DFP72DRAFT_921158 [Ephemerocybe angulata]|uniref:Uncharacterized protein n=1 Tax=Ephemerocybe angulata TaxID=980116 RepID=A0A8H6HHF7_9AGAR|nr:hypothetical protein DFP72DRAFT_921158 [Tulosesus angulatus]
MKFTLAPLVSLLVGASYLVANAAAYSYNDYNELDARHQIDDVLSERDFGLEARETVDVPFQPSLRAFLEEAVTVHRRSMSEYQGHLEARAGAKVYVEVLTGPKPIKKNPPHLVCAMESGTREEFQMHKVSEGLHLELYTVWRGNDLLAMTPSKIKRKSLKELGVNDGDRITFKLFVKPKE